MENAKRCATCGYDAAMDAKFCPRCGGTQFYGPEVRCPVCGTNVPQGQYCAHCGADLKNPGAQVWRSCGNCGNPVHITHTNCSCCGAAYLPPVQPQQRKKRSNGWLALLLIPAALMLVGMICVGILEFLDNGFPQLNAPPTTTLQETSTGPSFHRPTQPHIPRPTTQPVESTQGMVPTEPTPTEPKPTEPTPTAPSSNIPSEFADNPYLVYMGDGYCETMTGDMVVMFLFVSDPTDGWTDAEQAEAEGALLDELRSLLSEAESYGAELNIQYVFGHVTIQTEFSRYSSAWKEEAMTAAGCYDGYKDQRKLEAYYEADQVPVVFLVDEVGRSYANPREYGNGFESLVVLEKDYASLRHEMCHLFGAEDMYFPHTTTEAAKQYLPNGIMYGDCEGSVDALTAFAIGWLDELTDEAAAFLTATNHLTKDDISEAREQDQLTGYGTKYFDGGHYTGWMIDGVFHGEGTCYWDDGNTYAGSWINGKRDGYGELTAATGYSYKGYWQDSEFHGTGTYTWSDGSTYVGDWVNGQREGYGELTSTAGFSYKGYWKNNDFHGTGTYTWPDGSVYTGAWVNDQRCGYGELQSAEGFSYKGEWKDDQRHGTGTATYSNGGTYTGEWVSGERHGQGTMTWKDGSYYTGAWENGTQNGKGEYYYAKYGTKYIGDFVNGKRHGWGTYYYADGTTYTGKWENDTRVD